MPEDTNLERIMKNDSDNMIPPNNTEEFYTESFAEALTRAIGYFCICEFVTGTNGLVEKSGIIYAVGNNFITLENPNKKQFTICDMFSLKFATVFDSMTGQDMLANARANGNSANYSSRRSYR